jgi:hypothetical protein
MTHRKEDVCFGLTRNIDDKTFEQEYAADADAAAAVAWFDGLPRMSDDEFEKESSSSVVVNGTPRPSSSSCTTTTAAPPMWSFSQAAKHAAAALKRRRSPNARTHYCLAASRQVKLAFDQLQQQIKKKIEPMTPADFQLLKQAISNFRVKLNVHDSKTFQELRILRIDVCQQEQAAELATHNAFIDKTPGNDQIYIDAKDRYLDLKQWHAELAKEIRRLEPKVKYNNIGDGLFRCDLTKFEPPGVPSQHTNIMKSSAHALRNILTLETARRTFISLSAITDKIRNEVAAFLTDNDRCKDRAEVVKQIKQSYAAAAAAKKQQQ